MTSSDQSLPIHLLRQHLFCPRVPWFQELLHFRPPQPAWVRQGVEFHKRQPELFRHRTLKRFGLTNAERHFRVPVASARWGLHGVIDCVLLEADAVYAVEIKLTGGPPARGHIVQCVAYGLLASEQFRRPCPRVFVVMEKSGKTWPFDLTNERIDEVRTIRDQIRANLEQETFPASAATPAQCTQCEYLNYCNDR